MQMYLIQFDGQIKYIIYNFRWRKRIHCNSTKCLPKVPLPLRSFWGKNNDFLANIQIFQLLQFAMF